LKKIYSQLEKEVEGIKKVLKKDSKVTAKNKSNNLMKNSRRMNNNPYQLKIIEIDFKPWMKLKNKKLKKKKKRKKLKKKEMLVIKKDN